MSARKKHEIICKIPEFFDGKSHNQLKSAYKNYLIRINPNLGLIRTKERLSASVKRTEYFSV